jgi:hypothetical protein
MELEGMDNAHPDSVRRVSPPKTVIPRTLRELRTSQTPTDLDVVTSGQGLRPPVSSACPVDAESTVGAGLRVEAVSGVGTAFAIVDAAAVAEAWTDILGVWGRIGGCLVGRA